MFRSPPVNKRSSTAEKEQTPESGAPVNVRRLSSNFEKEGTTATTTTAATAARRKTRILSGPPQASIAKKGAEDRRDNILKPLTTMAQTTATPVLTQTTSMENMELDEAARKHIKGIEALVHESRNLKTEIKNGILKHLTELGKLLKEINAGKQGGDGNEERRSRDHEEKKEEERREEWKKREEEMKRNSEAFKEMIEIQQKLIEDNNSKMECLKKSVEAQMTEVRTYASVVANSHQTATHKQPRVGAALHSVIVESTDGLATGDEVLDRFRRVIGVNDGETEIEKIRKAKDGKVIVGCKTLNERQKVKDKIEKAKSVNLKVTELQNKDPLVALQGVLQCNTDTEIVDRLRSQNRAIFEDLGKEEDRIEIIFRKKHRNPHLATVVLKTSPKLWGRLTGAEEVRIDIKRVRAVDQSPLVQCTLCLAYGHSKSRCEEKEQTCSHCGGNHTRIDCEKYKQGTPPQCANCSKSKQAHIIEKDHNTFDSKCPIRRKWDALARARVAYC